MTYQSLDVLPIWGIYLVTVVGSLLFAELGYQLGKRQQLAEEGKQGTVGSLSGATLALLAFLLVFLIGIASNRFDNRRQLVIKEANAIGTTYLRAGYLEEPYRTDIRDLLQEYVDIRLAAVADPSKLPQAITRSEEIQAAMWAQAETLARANPDSDVIALFIVALNEVIDVHGERTAAIYNRISLNIWLVLFFMAGITMLIVGFQNGLAGNRNFVALLALILVFSAVILLIVDLDRPQQGLLQISQQALVDLQRQISAGP